MIMSMILAHLVGDYILQWDSLAAWKSQKLAGVLVHCSIVTAVTFIFILPFEGFWWQGALFISACHLFIDLTQLPITQKPKNGVYPLLRFIADQLLHIMVIALALYWGGYFQMGAFWPAALIEMANLPGLMIVLVYTLLAMPAWVILEFTGYGLANGSPPNFQRASNKYVTSLERFLITTSVISGQYMLIPVITAPRLYYERESVVENKETAIYLTKLLGSIALATVMGVGLRWIV